MIDHETDLLRWDLYKSYGEFNLQFENAIESLRTLLIELIRISYNYSDVEDDEGNELKDEEQDRLVKILMQNMSAMEITENSKACFIDFFTQQKRKHGTFKYLWNGDSFLLPEIEYTFALEVFNRYKKVIELRNTIIHSHYLLSSFFSKERGRKLIGRKDARTAQGYDKRKYEFNIDFFSRINNQIQMLNHYCNWVRVNLFNDNNEERNSILYKEELKELKAMNFSPQKEI